MRCVWPPAHVLTSVTHHKAGNHVKAALHALLVGGQVVGRSATSLHTARTNSPMNNTAYRYRLFAHPPKQYLTNWACLRYTPNNKSQISNNVL